MQGSLPGVLLTNGQSIPRDTIPVLAFDEFRQTVVGATRAGARIVSLFCARQKQSVVAYAVLADDANHGLAVLATQLPESYPSLTVDCPQAHLFEREMHEQFGVIPEGHPWLKPVRSGHQTDTLYPYFAMAGLDAHEVAVGPVHAGVIEPGHFRFQCDGEIVHHLEIHLGYQHRGVEEALANGPHLRTQLHIETVAGDTTVANATAYAMALEGLSEIVPSPRAQALRSVALELERLANHIGDIGALAGDIGYLKTAASAGRLRGDVLNITMAICGSRLGRNWIRPGGVAFDITGEMQVQLQSSLERTSNEVMGALKTFFGARSVLARLKDTGRVSTEAAQDLGFVGVAARASGVAVDVRQNHPAGWFRQHDIQPTVESAGDVLARALVRRAEIENSLAYVHEQIGSLPTGPLEQPLPHTILADQFIVSLCEGWRGEVAHVVLTGADGGVDRYKLTDPSFHNWTALAMAMRGQQISDFPLCNKSFNLSYCGFDL